MVQKVFIQFSDLQALKPRLTTQNGSYGITPPLSEHSVGVVRQFKANVRLYL